MNEEIIHFMNNIDFENTDEVYNIIYKLVHNWNELKKYVEELLGSKYIHKYDVLDKMQELEEGGNNDN